MHLTEHAMKDSFLEWNNLIFQLLFLYLLTNPKAYFTLSTNYRVRHTIKIWTFDMPFTSQIWKQQMSLPESMTKTMTSKQRSSHISTAAPLVEHGMQKWPSPHTAATVKEDENRWPMANYTCPSHPETNNIMKLSRNWGQPPATHLTMNKRRARSKGGTLSLFQ